MQELNIPPMLWLVGFQMGLYALAWGLCGALLGEDRVAVVHWGAFLLLIGGVMLLAGARGEPRYWVHYNGANVLSLLAFAVMRRGTERFMRGPSHDGEQAIVLILVGGAVAWVGPDAQHASWRVVLTYGGQAYIVLRTMWAVRGAMHAEFGRNTVVAIVAPGVAISLMLAMLALRQALDFNHPVEMQRNTGANYGLMYYYLGGMALFNFGFMVMLTQRLVVRLREVSQRDALTGLFNRRAIDEELAHQWQRYRRSHRPFAVLLVDIDHFKRINDTLGHAAGDQVLSVLAALLQRHARSTDAVGRIGGEEFLVLLADIDEPEALRSAERLRAEVEGLMPEIGGKPLAVTVSVGVALSRDDDPGVETLVARADGALYRAKAQGRNQSALGRAAGRGDVVEVRGLNTVCNLEVGPGGRT